MATASRLHAILFLVPFVAMPAATARAGQTTEAIATGTAGQALFKTYCGSCHGPTAQGDGPLADSFRFGPPDLTPLARRNGGRFDAEKVRRIIDGRNPLKGHGGPEMPVWGDAFKRSAEGYSEKAVKTRIESITEYLRSVQVK
jgi:mono/diheme cytochrome c family protein